ncbi:hypothetical protein KY333_00860 [Candidatus Woesearchaeota archaeon]|nr:hypothetical protein [Candidatus Woesearchaeota archaeon]
MGSDRLERRTRQFLKQGEYDKYLQELSVDKDKNTFVCDIANNVVRAVRATDMKEPKNCVRACDYVWAAPIDEIPEHDKPYVITKLMYWHNRQR